MPRIAYMDKAFRPDSLETIRRANAICAAYAKEGYDLTLRQLYYQFVSRDWIANRDSEYKRLGSIVNDARLAGMIDWKYIVDRTRNLRALAHWETPVELVGAAAEQFRFEKWARQPYRVEVWIEKDALVGVLESCCPELDVPYFSCRGYTSQSEIWGAAQRLGRYIAGGQKVVILHLGDHDPSGIDMTRDIEHRLATFIAQDLEEADPTETPEDCLYYLDDRFTVERVALNMAQIRHYNPPPNPAKITDSRATGYIAKHGRSSWELDALEPTVLVNLIREAVANHRDDEIWDESIEQEETERQTLAAVHDRWDDVRGYLNGDA